MAAMARPDPFAAPGPTAPDGPAPHRAVVPDHPLRRVLAFTGRTIDDVVGSDVAKREVLGYYKLQQDVRRTCERVDLERWWAGKGRRPRRGP